jgi:HAE1 family hydrophobic/amphiphilic exporter-1
MLCSRFLKPPRTERHGRLYNVVERGFDLLLRSYTWTLDYSIRFKAATMTVGLLLLAGTIYLFTVVPTGFIPSVDIGQLNGQIEAPEGIGYESLVASTRQVMDVFARDPNIKNYTANAGDGGGRVNLDLKPRGERSLSADQVIQELRPKLAAIPGVRVYLSNPPAIRIGGRQSRSDYQFTLQGTDTAALYRAAPKFQEAVSRLDGLQDVTSDLQITTPELAVDLDREQIAALGLTVDEVESSLSSAYGSRQISQIYAPEDQYQVIMQVAPQY